MGVSGAGKSTLGHALGAALGWKFVEGDALHPSANVAKMAAGVPLDDTDRGPFLENVAAALLAHGDEGVVASCSALRRRYRDLLRGRAGPIVFVLPMLERTGLAERLAGRARHFMPVGLLDSQLATLDPPAPDEDVITVDGMLPTDVQVAAVLDAMELRARGG